MRYLVDGYNVTKHDPSTRALTLEEQRAALVSRLRARGTVLLGSGEIVIVWDGSASAGGASASGSGTVREVFARTMSADDEIVLRVGRAKGETVVVTDDSELRMRAKSVGGARVSFLGRERCFEASGKGSNRAAGKNRGIPRDAGLPPGANMITKELKDLWLGEGDE